MKHRRYFLAFCLLLSITFLPSFLHSQVYTGSLSLTNQAQVDTFSYTEVTGDLTIGNGVVNVDSMNSLVKIGGSFEAFSTTLLTINGLQGLKSIGGNLKVTSCSLLTEILGFQQVDTIFGEVVISNLLLLDKIDGLDPLWVGQKVGIVVCPVLKEFSGFSQITSCGGISLGYFSELSTVNGFSNLEIVDGDFIIGHCDSLLNLDFFPSLSQVNGNFSIGYNLLENVDSLINLTTVGGDFFIHDNSALSSLQGFSNLTSVGDILSISSHNSALTSLAPFSNLTKLNGTVQIFHLPGVTSLYGFHNVDSILGTLFIATDSLVVLDGFDSLRYVEKLYIKDNLSLQSIVGMNHLERVSTNFIIEDNPSLELISGFDSLSSIGTYLSISNNAKLINIEFNSLEKVESTLAIGDNNSLSGIDGFQSLDSVKVGLFISENPSLSSIHGFDSLQYVGNFPPPYPYLPNFGLESIIIHTNPSLVDACGLHSMFTKLSGTTLVTFYDNFPGITLNQIIQNGPCFSGGYPVFGNLYLDGETSCTKDSLELGLANVLVKSVSGSSPRFAISDSFGNYEILLDSGAQTLEIVLPPSLQSFGPLLSICDTIIHVTVDPDSLPIVADDWGINVPNCPLLTTNVSGIWNRSCFQIPTTLHYSNQGNSDAILSKYYLKLPYYLTILSSTVPYQVDQNGLVVFDLGTIPAYSSGTITLQTQTTCNVYLRDIEQCLETWITSPSTCVPSAPGWSGASLQVLSECQGDTAIHFQVISQGSGPMTDSTAFRLFGNQSVAATGKLKLDSTNSFSFVIPSDTKTYRLEVDQVEFHPFGTEISAAVEGCYTPINSLSSTRGQISIFPKPQSLNLGSYSSQCRPIFNAFDPNDKKATPVGFGPDSVIHPGTTISYRIRFQNTGNDTAFNILLVDTLDAALDIASLRILSASHSFIPSITGKAKKILKFKFSDILLPDSTTNEPGSHGYIEFEMDHIAGIPLGTEIQNFADIYFDFNPPIRTNTTHQTVDTITLDTLPVSYTTFTSTILPDAPGLLTINDTLETYSFLQWMASATGEFAYLLERAENDSTAFYPIDTVSMSTFSLIDSFPEWGDTYFYRVRAISTGGISEPSNIVSRFSAIPPAFSPEIENLYQSGPSSVILEWTDSTVLCSEYLIERSEDSLTFSVIANVDAALKAYEDSVPTVAQGYWYRILSVNPTSTSLPSDTAYTFFEAPVPQAPSGLVYQPLQAGIIMLSWVDHAEYEEGFILEKGSDSTQFMQLAVLDTDVTSFSDSTVSQVAPTYYRIKAFNSTGESGYSNMLEVDFTLDLNDPLSGIEIYPNPVENRLQVVIPTTFSGGEISLYNVLGEVVLAETFESTGILSLDLSYLAKGSYFLRIKSGKSTGTWSILKQ